tara:strand:+ start:84937 stop:85995 length:1059 start_codon:yes stop_codon:yes gene_type:complete
MSNICKIDSQKQRYKESSLWIAKMDIGLTKKEAHSLQKWMHADPRNKALLFDMAQLWDKLETLSQLSNIFENKKNTSSGLVRYSAIAACFIVAFFMSFVPIYYNDVDISAQHQAPQLIKGMDNIYATAVGEQSQVTLSDGTKVVLNTNSLLQVNYTKHQRTFILKRGEINIDVAHDISRPLKVFAGNNIIQAVGTAFNVELMQDNRIELIVTDGKVLVDENIVTEFASNQQIMPMEPRKSYYVSYDHIALLGTKKGKNSAIVKKIKSEDIQVNLSWRQGNLIFRGESLAEVITEISRYTSVEFLIMDDKLNNIKVAGVFQSGDVDALLLVLQDNFDIKYHKVSNQKILLNRG